MKIRLNKYLANSGICSRRKCDELIKRGKVEVNEKIVSTLGTIIDESNDIVKFQGKVIKLTDFIYVVLNKPKGYLCSAKRHKQQDKLVFDLVKSSQRLFSVGRLDKDSRGLLILTNDGELANKLMHPKFEKEKEYQVKLNKRISPEFISKMKKGMIIAGEKYLIKSIKKIADDKFIIILNQGKKRQIRVMCKALGYQVTDIYRTRINSLILGDLESGEYKFVSRQSLLI